MCKCKRQCRTNSASLTLWAFANWYWLMPQLMTGIKDRNPTVLGLDFVNLFLGFLKRKKSSVRLWRSCTCVLNIAANSCWLVKSCIKSLVMMLATILRLIKPKQKRVVQNLSFKKKNSRIMVMWCNFYGHESSYDLNLSEFFKILRIYFFIIIFIYHQSDYI